MYFFPLSSFFLLDNPQLLTSLSNHIHGALDLAGVVRGSDCGARAKYEAVAQILTGNLNASASDGVAWVQELVSDLKVAPLSAYGLTSEHFPEAVEKTMRASSTKGNPLVLTADELMRILEKAI